MSLCSDSDGENWLNQSGLFDDPEGYYPPPPEPTFVTFKRELQQTANRQDVNRDIKMRLVGSNPLWGHYLWNAAKRLANYLDEHTELIKNKNVVELGAAAGLPSLICALNDAKKVVATDYPDRELIENLGFNFRKNVPEMVNNGQALVKGYIWGNSTEGLMEIIEPDQEYDLILLSDLIFNHSQHHALLKSCRELLGASASNNLPRQQKPQRASSSPLISKKSNGQVLVFFTHHRPWLADRDMKFFELAESPEYGFRVEKVLEEYVGPMFEEDPGDVVVRGTVHGYVMLLA